MEYLGGYFKKRNAEGCFLGVSTFTASLHSVESCGSDGLPLTPNSIKILGRLEYLKTLSHPNLCVYVDMARGKHERLICVSETFRVSLKSCFDEDLLSRMPELPRLRLIFEIGKGLEFLRGKGITHRNLNPGNVLLDQNGRVKLANFGLFHCTDHGCLVSFPIGNAKYLAPEVLVLGFQPIDAKYARMASSKADSWAFGMLGLEVFVGQELWKGLTPGQICVKVLRLCQADSGGGDTVPSNAFDRLRETEKALRYAISDESAALLDFFRSTFTIHPPSRPHTDVLMEHKLLSAVGGQKIEKPSENSIFREERFFLPIRQTKQPSSSTDWHRSALDFFDKSNANIRRDFADFLHAGKNEDLLNGLEKGFSTNQISADRIAGRTPQEVFHLWLLAGGDLEGELRRVGLIKTKPPILCLPRFGLLEGEVFGVERDENRAYDDSVVILKMEQLKARLANFPPAAYFPLLEEIEKGCGAYLENAKEALKLPLVIREKDVEYQLHRMVTFSRLLEGYPCTRATLVKEARKDISPMYRAQIWASLLDVVGDVESEYCSVDKETPTATDRQIEVDIPRCHQYDELLASPAGHRKFKRILKAWVASHPQYVYWQGLDSLCAPFLRLNFCDEAMAFACLSSFIDKYLAGFFLRDNSTIIQEYLATFSHLVAFHDPQLFNHLDEIGFIPELYAIPWFLTMYTHVFPLSKILHLWDTLLLGPPSFPLCVGVGLLYQLRDSLLSFSFNDCILLFSDMPQIDIERCVQDSIKFFCSTPPSVLFRRHEVRIPSKQISDNLVDDFPEMALGSAKPGSDVDFSKDLHITPLPLPVLKNEKCPQISARDVLDLLNLRVSTPESPNPPSAIHMSAQTKAKVFPLDVRTKEEFLKGCVPGSTNIPYQVAFDAEGQLAPCPEAEKLVAAKGKIIVVIGNRGSVAAVQTAEQLVKLESTRVCVLHKGIESLRTSNVLEVPYIS